MMNPETNKFEMLKQIDEEKFKDKFAKRITEEFDPTAFVRPNGEPVPKHWSVFKEGEELVVKNYTFRVAHIGEKHLLLEPVGIPAIGQKTT